MKKIKLLFLTILIGTLCTGCTIEYNINITNNEIKEVINVTDQVSDIRSNSDILKHYNMWYPTFVNFIKKGETIEIEDFSKKVDGIEYHNKKINKINNGYKYTYDYTYDIGEYHDSYALANAFIETTIHEKNGSLVLRTSKENLLCQYDYFDSVKVNITIDPEIYKLNYTNTSNIRNNTYTWTLDRSNCNDSQIILTLDKNNPSTQSTSSNNNNTNETKKDNSYVLYIFLGILVLIIYFGYKWFLEFKEKNNNIDDN